MKGFAVGFLNFLLAISIAVLGLTFMINTTILNPDFVMSELDKFDVSSLVKEQLGSTFIEQIPQQVRPWAQDAIDATLDDPRFKEQMKNVIVSAYDYIKGDTENLTLAIQTGPMVTIFIDNLLEEIRQSPPPELAGVPIEAIEPLVEQFVTPMLPSEIDVADFFPQITGILQQVRQYVGYIQIAFKASLIASILFVVGIVLILRQVKGITRKLGITFTVYGAVWLVGILVLKQVALPRLGQFGFNLLAEFQTMIPQLVNDILHPLLMYTIGFLIAGVVLLIISRIVKKPEAA